VDRGLEVKPVPTKRKVKRGKRKGNGREKGESRSRKEQVWPLEVGA